MKTILICEDDHEIQHALADEIGAQGYAVHCVDDGAASLQAISEGLPDAVILDWHMPHVHGCEVLKRVRDLDGALPILVITGSSKSEGVEDDAVALGADVVLRKPFRGEELIAQLSRLMTQAPAASRRHDQGAQRARNGGSFASYGELLGQSDVMLSVFETLCRIQDVAVPTVLVIGESGTGKELAARAIHTHGPRRNHPYVEIDCAAVPETLIESELFGHEKGSFTDARQLKRGLFEVGGKGTIFLDEIGEMALSAQAKLLRALETRRFKRVGGVSSLSLEAGIIAATNRNLRAEVKAGRFREDLYFRLHVVPIVIPPLRARTEDVSLIAEHLVARLSASLGRKPVKISDEAAALLCAYSWPGNVRELRNVIERAIILKRGDGPIEVHDLPLDVRASPQMSSLRAMFPLPAEGVALSDVEQTLVEQALERAHGVRTHAARLLGISRFALRYRLEKFGLLDDAERGERRNETTEDVRRDASRTGGRE